eukprot:724929-Amphidinium_carterae.1
MTRRFFLGRAIGYRSFQQLNIILELFESCVYIFWGKRTFLVDCVSRAVRANQLFKAKDPKVREKLREKFAKEDVNACSHWCRLAITKRSTRLQCIPSTGWQLPTSIRSYRSYCSFMVRIPFAKEAPFLFLSTVDRFWIAFGPLECNKR